MGDGGVGAGVGIGVPTSSKRIRRNVLGVERSEAELAEGEVFARLEREIARLERLLERRHERVRTGRQPPL